MKVVDKKSIKSKNRKKPFIKPKKEKILVVAQEFKFAKLLSGNEKTTRDRVLKTFKKWLINCFSKNYVFKEGDFIRVWKGLFYAVWMSDKPLVQEDLCESISHILDLFPNDQFENALMMIKVGFKVLATEWYGIDQHRIDKFMMLVRRYLRGSFRCLLRMQWDLESCKAYANMLASEDGILALETPFYARNALSLILHITDCYLEELAKIAAGRIPEESLVELVEPFLRQECGAGRPEAAAAARRLLAELLRHSAPARRHDAALAAWRQMGYPAGGPDALELVSDDEAGDEEEEENDEIEDAAPGPLDPRAGRVDVSVAPLPVPAARLAARVRALLARAPSARLRRRAAACLLRLEKVSRDEPPLTLEVAPAGGGLRRGAAARAARGLAALDRDLVRGSDELALRGLRRKHRKRLLARARAGLSIVDEVGAAVGAGAGAGGGRTERGGGVAANTENESTATSKPAQTQENKVKTRKRKNKELTGTDKKPKINETNDVSVNKTIKKSKNKNKENVVQNAENSNKSIVKVNSKNNNVLANKEENKNVIPVLSKRKGNVLVNGKVENKKIKTSKAETVSAKNNQEITETKKITVTNAKINKIDKKENLERAPQTNKSKKVNYETPKKVKFVLKNNCMQGPVDYYKSVRRSPAVPFDEARRPTKTNLKPSTPSPINPFFKKKLKLRG